MLNYIINLFKVKKISIIVFLLLNIIVLFLMISQIFQNNTTNLKLYIFSLILFILPFYLQKKIKIFFPAVLEILMLLFIFSTQILR